MSKSETEVMNDLATKKVLSSPGSTVQVQNGGYFAVYDATGRLVRRGQGSNELREALTR